MKHKRQGFTLVEIALFLAITGLLFAGIIAGTGNSIFQQRFNDSVQNYAEFLRSVYSEVSNPQGVGDGRSELAIFGKLVSFGQETDINGNSLGGEQRAYVYDVIGKADGVWETGGDALTLLSDRGATVALIDSTNTVVPAGIIETYYPRWGSSIENINNSLYKGSILIVRHPRSGTINTLVYDGTIKVNEKIAEANKSTSSDQKQNIINDILLKNEDGRWTFRYPFTTQTVDFCVNPYGVERVSDWRRDIRLVSNARNASGVEVIDMDLSLFDGSSTTLELQQRNGNVADIEAMRQTGNRCRFK